MSPVYFGSAPFARIQCCGFFRIYATMSPHCIRFAYPADDTRRVKGMLKVIYISVWLLEDSKVQMEYPRLGTVFMVCYLRQLIEIYSQVRSLRFRNFIDVQGYSLFLHVPYYCSLLTRAYFHSSRCNARILPPFPLAAPHTPLSYTTSPPHTLKHFVQP